MKQFYLSFLLLFIAVATHAATITAVSSASVSRPVTVCYHTLISTLI